MAQIPVLKLGVLFVKTLAKPVSKRLQASAAEHPGFRAFCVRLGNVMNDISIRTEKSLMGVKSREIKPLHESVAVARVVEFLGEAFVFTVGALLLVFEYSRQQYVKDHEKREKMLETRVAEALRQARFEALEGSVGAVDARLARIEKALGLPPPTIVEPTRKEEMAAERIRLEEELRDDVENSYSDSITTTLARWLLGTLPGRKLEAEEEDEEDSVVDLEVCIMLRWVEAIPAPEDASIVPLHPLRTFRLGGGAVVPAISIDWNDIIAVSNTTTTCQVVGNALLDRSVPVSKSFFASLKALGANNVRYVPWFVSTLYGLPAPTPATSTSTSWNFTFVQPMFEDVLAATDATVIPNFSTQPNWLFDTTDYSVPTNPLATDFGYPKGNVISTTVERQAAYYARLLSWIVKGEFVDENGVKHTGGPAYPLQYYELLNEPNGNCHGQTVQDYSAMFDAMVESIWQVTPNLTFVCGGLSQGGEQDWAAFLLNASNHNAIGAKAVQEGYLSFHFYAGASSRTDPVSYEAFFSAADAWFAGPLADILASRASLSPSTKLSADELGVILPDDNNPSAPAFPIVYWNAAAAKYAYVFAHLAKVGVEIAGESQLAGNPPLPHWGIQDPQFPSVALLDWNTGNGTARYWVLKMFVEEFAPGDRLVQSSTASSPICGVVDGHAGYGNLTITCATPSATISSIDFAAFGTPTGTCGAYQHNASCDAQNVTTYVKAHCIGQHSCTTLSYPTFGDPCYGTFKQLVIQARCSDGKGGSATPSGPTGIFAQGFISGPKSPSPQGSKKILLVNKESTSNQIKIDSILPPGQTATLRTVDEATGFGPPRESTISSSDSPLTLAPFAVALIKL